MNAILDKLKEVWISLDIPFDEKYPNWKNVKWLFNFRNSIAHAKPEELITEKIISQKKFDSQTFSRPKSKKIEANLTKKMQAEHTKQRATSKNCFLKKCATLILAGL